MCGFSGYIFLDEKKVILDDFLLRHAALSIGHRGPDGEGTWFEGSVGLVHRRLSILDVSTAGHQPFHSPDGRYVMVFNGEIYNFRDFIPELEAFGYIFHSKSDTEVLVALWTKYGPAVLPRLNGMWAFALWDRKERELILCRDRLGVKPLYIATDHEAWFFGSEPKALFALGLKKEINFEALREHFVFRYLEGDKTLFKGVRKLLPGSILRIKGNKTHSVRWWNLMEVANSHDAPKKPIQWFDDIFHNSLNYRMVSDVPVGILQSAGLDSSSVALGLKENGFDQLQTYTIKFNDSTHNEAHLASRFAHQLGYSNNSLLVEGSTLLEATIKATFAADQPLVHQNDGHLVAISKLASEHVKVLLSGEGADELMGGYIRYKPFRHIQALIRLRKLLTFLPLKSQRLQKLQKFLFSTDQELLMMWSAGNFFPSDLKNLGMEFEERTGYRQQILNEAKKLNNNDTLKQMLYLEQHTYLQSLLDRNDATTMISGIECREPFLDYRLVEGLMRLPSDYFVRGGKGKYLLQHTLGSRLPLYISNFQKIGLSVPWNKILRKDDDFRNFILNSNDLEEQLGISLKKHLALFFKGDDSCAMIVRYLFFYNIWKHTNSISTFS